MGANSPRYLSQNTNPQPASNLPDSGAASSSVHAATGWWSDEHAKLFTQWSSAFENYSTSYNNPYFDYFYTGQDIQVSIDGLSDVLPIYAMGYNIQQQKTPIYGFWDYTYSAMLRGTRIITGSFSIVATKPYLLTEKIAAAARIRAMTVDGQLTGNIYAIRGLNDDETRIDRFWRKNYDSNLDIGQQHLFSIHPPFNFLIRFGLQETSMVSNNPTIRANELRNRVLGVDPMLSDFNERLVQNPTPELDMQILLENIELISKSTEYNADGDPILETYSFMARDERMLKPIDYNQTISAVSDPTPAPYAGGLAAGAIALGSSSGGGGGGFKVT